MKAPYRLFNDDCLRRLPKLKGESVDLVYADLPYGTTANKWDSVIPLGPLWEQLFRVVKPNRPVVLHAAEPFTSVLIVSQLKRFRYRWTWNKVNRATGFLDAKKRPLRVVEDVVVFSHKSAPLPYHPQMRRGSGRKRGGSSGGHTGNYNKSKPVAQRQDTDWLYPLDLLDISAYRDKRDRGHATQKPVEVAEYFVKTYSDPGAVVLDVTMGSGTAGIACARLGRKFIGIERDPEIFAVAEQRVRIAYETGLIVPAKRELDRAKGLFERFA